MPPEDGTGATPGAGATPAQPPATPPADGATPPAATTPPAGATPAAGTDTDDDTSADITADEAKALGDAGKRILADARREAREAAQRATEAVRERDALRQASQSDQEKAIDAARKEGSTEADARWSAIVRRTQVERALTAAGVNPTELSLAASAPEFAAVELADDGSAKGLDPLVQRFKEGHASLFATASAPAPGGAWGGAAGGKGTPPASLEEAVTAELTRANR